eukprot:403331953
MSCLFGYQNLFLGRLLYLLLSKGFDKSKIYLSRFITVLQPLKNDDMSFSHAKFVFKLLDLDRDEELNILNLLTLYQNIPPSSLVGQEISRLVEFIFEENITSKRVTRKPIIDIECFKRLLPNSILKDELRYKIFGILPQKKQATYDPAHFLNIFEPMPEFQTQNSYLFRDLESEEEQSYGQRGFGKNMDKNLFQLLKFYNKYYNKKESGETNSKQGRVKDSPEEQKSQKNKDKYNQIQSN